MVFAFYILNVTLVQAKYLIPIHTQNAERLLSGLIGNQSFTKELDTQGSNTDPYNITLNATLRFWISRKPIFYPICH